MKKILITLVLLTAFLFAFGCSRKDEQRLYGESQSLQRSMADGFYLEEASIDREAFATAGEVADVDSISANASEAERKLVKRADIRIRVENLETADASISSLMKKYNAYAASTNLSEDSYRYSLRVPAKWYELFLDEINIGRQIHRSENTEDVTIRYYDLEGRLETKKELLRTYQAYLRRATNIEEILKVEAQIANLQHEIDGTGQQLRQLANQVDYATIELVLLGPAAATQRRGETFGERIKQTFGGFGIFLFGVALVLINIVIYVIPIFLLIVFFVWLFFGRIGLLKKLWRIVVGEKQE